MYTNVRSLIPLAAKYSHETFEEALLQMTQKYCKQHEPGHCASVHRFPWQPKKKPEKEVEEEEEAEEEAEDPLCQT
jgi:hypothetical protein